jgi:TPR repeat protein
MSGKGKRSSDDFARACEVWDGGDVKLAYRLFHSLALRGDLGAQLNVGYFFDQGIGVRRNETKALFWYRRAYRRKHASAANNIGTIYRDRGETDRAIRWFQRAVALGDESGLLEIAKLRLRDGKQKARTLKYLERVTRSSSVTQAESEEAKKLLGDLEP